MNEKSYINGEFVCSDNQKIFPVFNPYNQERITDVADCGAHQTDQAVQKAYEAFQSWRQLRGIERSRILRRWYELQMENLRGRDLSFLKVRTEQETKDNLN